MEKRTKPSILQNFDCEVTALIAQNRGISQTEALRRFLNSKTHEMLEDDDMKLYNTDYDKLQFEYKPTKIVFKDGTTLSAEKEEK